MAELLKREYNLIVLKADVLDTRPNLRFTLQAKVDGVLRDVREWRTDTSELGLQRGQRTVQEPALPEPMFGELLAWMSANAPYDQPLWIHLVKPYGLLRQVPWERVFGPTFHHPVLMLPDFLFPPPLESTAALDVALCASAPLHVEDHTVRQALGTAIREILDADVRETHVHVFADEIMLDELRLRFAQPGNEEKRVTIHATANAEPYVISDLTSRLVDVSGQVRSPWLLWMRDTLQSQSIDVVHFIGHGYLSRERGALLFAQSPIERTDEYRAGPVGALELSTFLNQIGAWGTVFSCVQMNNSETGLRALGDEIAQMRPGPMLMHVHDHDPDQSMLAAAYRLLFATEPVPMPASNSLFVYCQPYRVVGSAPGQLEVGAQPQAQAPAVSLESPVARNAIQTDVAEGLRQRRSPLSDVFERATRVRPWVAATERVAEQAQLKLQTFARDDAEIDSGRSERAAVTLDVLDSLRASVAGYCAEDAAAGMDGATA